MFKKYLTYLKAWYKTYGLSTAVIVYPSLTFSLGRGIVTKEGPVVLRFQWPITWYKNELEQQWWISAAKDLKALSKKHHGRLNTHSQDYYDFRTKYSCYHKDA